MFKKIASILLFAALTGCVPYHAIQQDSSWGYKLMGYAERINRDGSFYLEFHGNGFISNEEILRKYQKRAAELCINDYESDPKILTRPETKFENLKDVKSGWRHFPMVAGNVYCK